jgi:hypothetical protein
VWWRGRQARSENLRQPEGGLQNRLLATTCELRLRAPYQARPQLSSAHKWQQALHGRGRPACTKAQANLHSKSGFVLNLDRKKLIAHDCHGVGTELAAQPLVRDGIGLGTSIVCRLTLRLPLIRALPPARLEARPQKTLAPSTPAPVS